MVVGICINVNRIQHATATTTTVEWEQNIAKEHSRRETRGGIAGRLCINTKERTFCCGLRNVSVHHNNNIQPQRQRITRVVIYGKGDWFSGAAPPSPGSIKVCGDWVFSLFPGQ